MSAGGGIFGEIASAVGSAAFGGSNQRMQRWSHLKLEEIAGEGGCGLEYAPIVVHCPLSDQDSISAEEQQQQQGQNGEAPKPGESIFKSSNHPTALMFHLAFKVAAIIFYILGGILSSSFVFSFVIVVLLLAFDFWTVKNVTGRLLVGLRWWNEVKEDGTNEWRFESREDTSRIADIDSRVFWLTLWLMPLVWSIFFISTFLSLNWGWLLCTVVGNVLSGANLYGYIKCSRAAKEKVGSLATNVAASMFASRFAGGGGGGAGGSYAAPGAGGAPAGANVV